MFAGNVFYHGTIRKTIVAFGRLFSDIYIDRKQGDSVSGDTVQRLQIPISYAPKEKWLVRIEQDPSLEQHTYTTLPRMSFEINGYSYDPQRKLPKMNKLLCNDGTNSNSVFSPVPYNVDISLYILTKTQEDAMQILEQILPTFAPEYTLAINSVPEMNIIQDVPISLNSISLQDEYDGDFATRRFVTHTLNFTLKLNLFGNVSDNKPIYNVVANVSTNEESNVATTRYEVEGDSETYTVISEDWIEGL
jgi:hypothetical protein